VATTEKHGDFSSVVKLRCEVSHGIISWPNRSKYHGTTEPQKKFRTIFTTPGKCQASIPILHVFPKIPPK
jgi:hypothetical protein